jgi:hypothetical protein
MEHRFSYPTVVEIRPATAGNRPRTVRPVPAPRSQRRLVQESLLRLPDPAR